MALYAKYDIPGYKLTLPDGTVLYFAKTESPATANAPGTVYYDPNGLSDSDYSYVHHTYLNDLHLDSITDSSGNTLTIQRNSTTGKVSGLSGANLSLTFQRNAQGRITGAYAPAANPADPPVLMVRYAYTAQGDLDHVDRLVDPNAATEDERWQSTYYHYQHLAGHSTHKIKSLTSDSGKTPILNEYDPITGKLVATIDAFGKRIEYTHNTTGRQEIVTDRNGGQSVYFYDDLGNVTSMTNPAGETTTYEYGDSRNPDKETSITTAYGTPQAHMITYTYDAQGNRTSETDTATGLTQSWHYLTVHNKQVLDWSVDPQGLRTENSYDASGNLTATITLDRTGHLLSQTTFSDYFKGQPRVVTSFVVAAEAASPSLRSVSTFNSHGYLTDSYQQVCSNPESPDNHLWTTTARTRYTLDQRGNLTATTQYQPTPTPAAPTSGLTESELNQNWTIALPATTTDYDQLGRPYLTTTYTGLPDDPATPEREDYLTTSTLYNEDGQVWRTYDARHNYTETEYDELGQVIAARSYSATGTLLSSSTTTYTANGQVATSTDALGNTTRSYYDAAGRSVRTVSPDGTSSETLYDSAGRAYLTIDHHVATQPTGLYGSLSLFDAAGRSIGTQCLSGIALIIVADDATHQATVTADTDSAVVLSSSSTHYNALGQVDYSISEAGQRTEYVYDAAGRQYQTIQKAVPVWNPATGQTVATDLTTTTMYDGLGRAYQTVDALNHTTTTLYDDQGRVSRTVFHNGSFIAYGYDAQGRKISESKQLPAGTSDADIAAASTLYTYSELGQLTDVSLPAVDDPYTLDPTPVRPTWHYTYDQYGQQLTQTDPYGHTTSFTYDPLTGNRTSRTLPAVNGETVSESWLYDDLGRLSIHTNFKGQSTRYHYDPLGQVDVESRFAAGKDPQTAVADETTEYHYDAIGNRDRVTIRNASGAITRLETCGFDDPHDPTRLTLISSSEGTIHYVYSATGELTDTWTGSGSLAPSDTGTSTWMQYTYDELGRLHTITAKRLLGVDRNFVTTYSYDEVGNLASVLQPNGVLTSYTYDPLNRLESEIVTQGGQPLASYVYHLLPDGNRDYVIETDASGARTRIDWTYDADGRLTREVRDEGYDTLQNGGDYADDYTLDLVGNRTKKAHDAVGTSNDETIVSQYNERDQLEITGPDADADGQPDLATATTYTYDDNGSQETKTEDGVTAVYHWDLQNHMDWIDTNGDGTPDVTYQYNSDGVRVAETANDQTTYYLNDPQDLTGYTKAIEDRTDTNADGMADQTDKAYILGTQIIGQANSSQDIYFLLLDGHGSTRAVTNTSGSIVESYDYAAFGEALNFAPNSAKTNWQFGGDGVWDPNSRFTYHLKRFRDGDRFVSYDPFEADPTTPASLHKYLYASAAPTGLLDPTGNMGAIDQTVTTGIGNQLQSTYNGLVAATADYISMTALGIASGQSATAIFLQTTGALAAPVLFKIGGKLISISFKYVSKGVQQVARLVLNPTFAIAAQKFPVAVLIQDGISSILPICARPMRPDSFSSAQLRAAIAARFGYNVSKDFAGYAAHHLIPRDLASHPLFRRFPMEFDDATNGIMLLTQAGNQHAGNHRPYSDAVELVLDRIWASAQRIPEGGTRMQFISDKLRAIQKTAASALYEGASMVSDNSKEVWNGYFSQI